VRPLSVALGLLLLSVLSLALPRHAHAQEATVWVQIEAQPTLAAAEDRAKAWSALFPETGGFRLRSGWYAVMLGPYPEAEARARLASLRQDGLIPSDSFIAFPRDFGSRFWPPEGVAPTPPVADPQAVAVAPTPEPTPVLIPDETPAEARDSEVLLTPEERNDLQIALEWFGFYQGKIDGAFGPGTRAAMAAWQEAQGVLDVSGILTTRQRTELLQAYRDQTASFGFAELVEAEAGITVTLPLGLVEFDHYEPPFVHFSPRDGIGPRLLLISQPGDQASLSGLYDLLQSLESVPLTGERSRDERSFRIRGTSATVDTTVFAQLTGGFIKGWMLISTPDMATRDARIIERIEASFATDATRALDPGMAVMPDATRTALLAGLELRRPRLSRSGFFVDAGGTVLTVAEAVEGCARVTLDGTVPATIRLLDAASGLALLAPDTVLSPPRVAEFQLAPERPGTEVMVAGYSYEDRLPAPVMTFGTLAEVSGLNGEPGLKRLALQALPGDAGGPVLDATGAVIGVLLPQALDGGKQLPPDVHFAFAAGGIAGLLAGAAVETVQSTKLGAIAPSDLTDLGTGMTVLVSCWD
jgi:peptidoglycan hydrolase-like protein with peptidoglycan-binding domain